MELSEKEKVVFFDICKMHSKADTVFSIKDISDLADISYDTARRIAKKFDRMDLLEKHKYKNRVYYRITPDGESEYTLILSDRFQNGETEDNAEKFDLLERGYVDVMDDLREIEDVTESLEDVNTTELEKQIDKAQKEVSKIDDYQYELH